MKRMKAIFLVVVMVFVSVPLFAQYDLDIQAKQAVNQTTFVEHKLERHKVPFGFSNNQPVLNITLGPLMYTYQRFLSPQISASCLYGPSCSEYSRHLFHEVNPLKAFVSTIDRLMRCDRIAATDIRVIQVDPKTGKKLETVNYYRFSHK